MSKPVPPVEEQEKILNESDEIAKIKIKLAQLEKDNELLKTNNTKLQQVNQSLYLRCTSGTKDEKPNEQNKQKTKKSLDDLIKEF